MENKNIKNKVLKLIKNVDSDFSTTTDKLIEDTDTRVFMAGVSLRILDWMEECNLDISQVAQKLDISETYLSRVLRGIAYREVTVEELLRYSKILGINLIKLSER